MRTRRLVEGHSVGCATWIPFRCFTCPPRDTRFAPINLSIIGAICIIWVRRNNDLTSNTIFQASEREHFIRVQGVGNYFSSARLEIHSVESNEILAWKWANRFSGLPSANIFVGATKKFSRFVQSTETSVCANVWTFKEFNQIKHFLLSMYTAWNTNHLWQKRFLKQKIESNKSFIPTMGSLAATSTNRLLRVVLLD